MSENILKMTNNYVNKVVHALHNTIQDTASESIPDFLKVLQCSQVQWSLSFYENILNSSDYR